MNESQLIAQAFHQLQRFCRDVSLLLSTAEEEFDRRHWSTAQTDKGCLWGGAYSLDRPSKWLPRRFYRTYKSESDPNILTFITVLIELPRGREIEDGCALLTAGALRYRQARGWGRPLTGAGADVLLWHLHRADRDDSGVPSWHHDPYRWSDDPLPKGLTSAARNIDAALTLAIPLHEIVGTASLISKVIDPLFSSLSPDPQSSTVRAPASGSP